MSGLFPLPVIRRTKKDSTPERATSDDHSTLDLLKTNDVSRQFRKTSSVEDCGTVILEGSDHTHSQDHNLRKGGAPMQDEESQRIKLIQKLRKELVVQKNDLILNKSVSVVSQEPKKVGQLFCEVLQQPKNQRSKVYLDALQQNMKDHNFFKTRNMKDQQILDVLNCMDFVTMPEDRIVFDFGSIGDLYYMIIEGVVEIQIVNKDESKLYQQIVSELLFKRDEQSDLKNLIKIYETQITEAQKILTAQLEANAKNKGGYEVGTSLMQKDVFNAQKRLEDTLVKLNLVSWEIQVKERFQKEELMIPVVHLGSGKDFGELALKTDVSNPTKIIPRAATVKCVTSCKFATMSKKDYQGILDKIDQKNIEKLVNFFKNVPFMQPMTKTQIQKSIVGFQKRNCIRGQVVCKEGTPATHVYIVYEGEFELTKTARLDVLSYFGKAEDNVSENLILKRKSGEKLKGPQNLRSSKSKVVPTNNQVRFGLICSGQVCGDDDIVADRNYKATLTCTGNPSSLYVIPKADFLRIFKSNEQVWKNLQKIKKTKAEQNAQCMNNYFSISLEDKERKVGKTEMSLKSNILLNQQEADYRYTLADIVKDYPYIQNNTNLDQELRKHKSSVILSQRNSRMGIINQYASSKYESVYQQFVVEGLGDSKSALRNKFGLVKQQRTNLKTDETQDQGESIEPPNIIKNFASWSKQSVLKSPGKDSQHSLVYRNLGDKNRIQLSKAFTNGSPKRTISQGINKTDFLGQGRNTAQLKTSLDQYGAKDKIVKVAYSLKCSSTHQMGFKE